MINKYIDFTNLKADATEQDIQKLCDTAMQRHYASVCVNSRYAGLCSKLLKDSDVNVVCVVGFPLGAMSSSAKAFEAKEAVANGAKEIDMVVAVGAVKQGDWEYVRQDIKAVQECGAVLKVIFETCLLTDEEIAKLSKLCDSLKVDFVKTSTGFSTGGATVQAVLVMKQNCGSCKIKASGGIRDIEKAKEYIALGVERIGTSSEL